MKKRIQLLEACIETGKMTKIEGVIVTPEVAEKLLSGLSRWLVAIGDLRTLCKCLQYNK